VAVMFLLLPVALVFSGVAVAVFVWAARDGQFDDLETPALRILLEDEAPGLRGEADQSVSMGSDRSLAHSPIEPS